MRADVSGRAQQERSRPVVEVLHAWLTAQLERVSGKSGLAEAVRYALHHWPGLVLFLDDGRIELDTNTVERAIRPIALGRKNALFAGSDGGARHWAIVASLVATAKLNGVEPLAWLTDVLERMVSGRTKAHELERCCPGPGRPSGSRPPFIPERRYGQTTLAEDLNRACLRNERPAHASAMRVPAGSRQNDSHTGVSAATDRGRRPGPRRRGAPQHPTNHVGNVLRPSRVSSAAAMLAAAFSPPRAPALSQSTGTTFSAPLTNGSTRAARTNGGQHTAEGWRVTSNAAGNAIGQYLMYVMPAGAKAGAVEFEARGFATGKYAATSDNREHVWGVCDKDVPHDMPESASSCFQLRLYDHKLPDGHLLRRRAPVPLHEPRDERHRRGQEGRGLVGPEQVVQVQVPVVADGRPMVQGRRPAGHPQDTQPEQVLPLRVRRLRLPQGGPGARERHVPQREDHEQRRRDLERQIGRS
jgi:hypothetical protein